MAWLILAAGTTPSWAEDAKALEFFESQIRPVLVEHCYECHSAEAEDVKGGLLLDSAAGMLNGGDSGPAIVPGKPDDSLLMEALRYESFEMPPAGRLPKAVVTDFHRWIGMGAPDSRTQASSPARGGLHSPVRREIDIDEGRRFWSFQPPREHQPPQVSDRSWPWSEIDRFILARLEAAAMTPAADADRATLIRRVSFDLTGLPPAPEEIDAFLGDPAPTAFETVVDRLLASPQFGVHWGRHWLDVARYADSNGGDFNATFHNAWRYRDYVVDALNRDKPFDRFIREQIAGDLLPSDSRAERTEQLVATGFLMIGTKMLSERDKEKLRMDVVDEQIDTVGRAFMGMTLGCARCHDHKFDPIPTQDYYALAGIFRSTRTLHGESQQYVSTWKRTALPAAAEHIAAVKKHQKALKEVDTRLAAVKKQIKRSETRLAKLKNGENRLVVDDELARLTGEWTASTYSPNFLGKGYIHDGNSGKGEKSVTFPLEIPKSAFYEVRVSYASGGNRADNVPVTVAHADGETVVTLDQTRKPDIERLFQAIGRFPFEAGKTASVTLSNRGTQGYVIADAVGLVEVNQDGKPVTSSRSINDESVEEAEAELETLRATLASLAKQRKQLEDQAPKPLPKAIAAADHQEIGDCELRIRGEHTNRGRKVKRGFLQVAATSITPPIPSDESGRRELAEWIASAENPLTARVIVNRLWSHLIGEGIVRSVDNFGQLGDRPTHPELLDHLAFEFVTDGWSIKRAVRKIVLSRAYQMSSAHDEADWKKDPENRLLWRAHRRRLPAEAIRDSMLAISGRLDLSPGGSPVRGLGTLVTTNNSNAQDFQVQESAKRTLYLPIIRNELPPILTAFDFANPALVTGKRAVTNVPEQALLLMNSPFVVDCARRTATRLLAAPLPTDGDRLRQAYRLTLGREPTAAEAQRALKFLARARRAEAAAIESGKQGVEPLAQLVQTLFASTQFRMLN